MAKWWLWGPLALGVAFIGYGFTIPKNEADANAFRRTCPQMGGASSDCARIESEIRHGKGAQTPAPYPPGVTGEQINAALEDGRKQAEKPASKKPTEWPKPPAVLVPSQ